MDLYIVHAPTDGLSDQIRAAMVAIRDDSIIAVTDPAQNARMLARDRILNTTRDILSTPNLPTCWAKVMREIQEAYEQAIV